MKYPFFPKLKLFPITKIRSTIGNNTPKWGIGLLVFYCAYAKSFLGAIDEKVTLWPKSLQGVISDVTLH